MTQTTESNVFSPRNPTADEEEEELRQCSGFQTWGRNTEENGKSTNPDRTRQYIGAHQSGMKTDEDQPEKKSHPAH